MCWVVDQRRLPDRLVDIEVRGAADAVTAINDGAITRRRGPGAARGADARARRPPLDLVAGVRPARDDPRRRERAPPGPPGVRGRRARAIDRQLALLEGFDGDVPGETVEAALRAEAEAIIAEASADHGALVDHALAALAGLGAGRAPRPDAWQHGPDGQRPVRHGRVGDHHRPPRRAADPRARRRDAARPRGRPRRDLGAGARRACRTRSSPTRARRAASPRRGGRGARRRPSGSAPTATSSASTGTYPLALAAAAADVPFVVLAATTAVDLGTPDAAAAPLEDGRPRAVLTAGGTRIAPEGTSIRNPRLDRTPASLLSAIVTEEGVVQAPFDEGLAAHVAGRGRAPRSRAGVRRALAGASGRSPDGDRRRSARGPVPSPARRPTARCCAQFLERDRLFAAYAICDLDEREFARTRWGVATEGGELVAVGSSTAASRRSRCS